jgi:ribosomal protein L32
MRECPTCHEQTPDGRFCVRCGAPLDGALEHARERRQFAAAPGEHRYAPWLISTLFPHLPRHSERHFRAALAVGGTLVVVLGVLRLFPVALITAALLMPLLTVLYFYDVDVYEREPVWAAAWTVGWGALTGFAVGVLAKAVAPTGPALIDKGSTSHVLTGGILIPLLGVVVMLSGPLVLLGRARFDEALDGASFAASTAATFAAAEAVVVGVGVLGGGLRPQGAAAPWVARLAGIAIATPVLSMSAMGAAGAALWLRYRAPVKDRDALGLLGRPPVAIAAAALLVTAGAIGETFMPAGVWLAWVVALDLVALVMLRRALHVGLLEEASEIEIGSPIRCTNCGAMTAAHTFCGNCGISLKALPKVTAPGAQGAARGEFAGRFAAEPSGRRSGRRRLLAYGVALAAIVGAAFAIGALAAPPAQKARCKRGIACGSPPIEPRAIFAFPGYSPWQSTGLGYSLRYNAQDWSISSQDADNLVLQAGDGFSLLVVSGLPASQASPAAMVDQRVSSLSGQLLGFAADSSAGDQILGTNVGLTPGRGGVYSGTITSPQGPQTPVSVAILAASTGGVSISATVIAPGNDAGDKAAVYQRADDIINSIQFSTP